VIAQDHFPEDPSWQLLAKPLTQGQFLRQPMLKPSFQAADLRLISPRRSVTDATADAMIVLKNPLREWIMASLEQNGTRIGEPQCMNNDTSQIICPLPNKGTYRVELYVSPQHYSNSYEGVGSLDFVNR
jgi:transglutaminase/protease-like cytokinesis protein 3